MVTDAPDPELWDEPLDDEPLDDDPPESLELFDGAVVEDAVEVLDCSPDDDGFFSASSAFLRDSDG